MIDYKLGMTIILITSLRRGQRRWKRTGGNRWKIYRGENRLGLGGMKKGWTLEKGEGRGGVVDELWQIRGEEEGEERGGWRTSTFLVSRSHLSCHVSLSLR